MKQFNQFTLYINYLLQELENPQNYIICDTCQGNVSNSTNIILSTINIPQEDFKVEFSEEKKYSESFQHYIKYEPSPSKLSCLIVQLTRSDKIDKLCQQFIGKMDSCNTELFNFR